MVSIVALDALVMSWTLQTTLGVVLLVAFWGMTRVFEGRAVRSIAGGWTAFFVLMLASLAYTAVARARGSDPTGMSLAAIEDVARVYMVFLWYPTAGVLAGKAARHRGLRMHTVMAATALVLAASDVVGERLSPWADTNVLEHVYPATWLWLAVSAWRLSRATDRNAAMLRWLSLGYLLYTVRVELAKLLVEDDYLQATTPRLLLAAAVQVAHVAAFGVICLVVCLVLERGRILQNAEQLRDAEVRLSKARRLASLGELAARIAHDFNNVLTIIMTGVQYAAKTLPSPNDAADILADVQQAARSSQGLVAQLLAFGKPSHSDDAGCEARQFFDERARSLAQLAGPSASLELTPPAAEARVGVDAVTLERVLYNLVTNARDAMPRGGTIRIGAAVERRERISRPTLPGQVSGGDYLRIAVEDTGTGIPPEVRERIFEPFFSTKGNAGTGLGLATVYAIVSQARGEVLVTSTVGKGTRFEVLLPVVTMPYKG